MEQQISTTQQITHALARRTWIIALCALALCVVGAGLGLAMPAVYQARATIMVNESTGTLPSYEEVLASERRAQTYAYLITADNMLQEALEQVDRRAPTDEEIEALRRAVEVQAVRGTQLIKVSVRDTSPDRAAALTGALLASLDDNFRGMSQARGDAARTELQRQLDGLDAEIASVTKDVAAAKDAARADLAPRLEQLQAARNDVLEARARLDVDLARGQLSIVQVEAPAASPRPVAPNVLLMALIGAALGLCVGIVVAIVHWLLSTRRHQAEQANTQKFAAPAEAVTQQRR